MRWSSYYYRMRPGTRTRAQVWDRLTRLAPRDTSRIGPGASYTGASTTASLPAQSRPPRGQSVPGFQDPGHQARTAPSKHRRISTSSRARTRARARRRWISSASVPARGSGILNANLAAEAQMTPNQTPFRNTGDAPRMRISDACASLVCWHEMDMFWTPKPRFPPTASCVLLVCFTPSVAPCPTRHGGYRAVCACNSYKF